MCAGTSKSSKICRQPDLSLNTAAGSNLQHHASRCLLNAQRLGTSFRLHTACTPSEFPPLAFGATVRLPSLAWASNWSSHSSIAYFTQGFEEDEGKIPLQSWQWGSAEHRLGWARDDYPFHHCDTNTHPRINSVQRANGYMVIGI
jgi:hypothetical protein